jgi:four helix bundle protein
MYKFEKRQVYQMALTYADMTYSLAEKLPNREEYNLRSQIIRAATSNRAEYCGGVHESKQQRAETVLEHGPSISYGDSSLSAPD